MTQVGSACRAGAWQIVYTRACELMHASLKQVLALWALMMLSVTAAVGDNPRVFIDAAACVASGAHSASDCRHAERNARAEFSEKAPRFPTRAACERAFARCMIGDIFAGGGVDFVPTLRGFAILAGPRAGALPVLEGGGSQGMFERRRIDRDDEGVHRGQDRRAQSASGISPGSHPLSRTAPVAEDPASNGGLQAYPVPAAALRELRERERKFGGASHD